MFTTQVNLFRNQSTLSIGQLFEATESRMKRWRSAPAEEPLPPLLLSVLPVNPSPVLLSPLTECLGLTSFDEPPTTPSSHLLSPLSDFPNLSTFDIPPTPPPSVAPPFATQFERKAPDNTGKGVYCSPSNVALELKAVACGTARFVLCDSNEPSDELFVHRETMDKNKNNEYYTQGQEDHPTQQSLSPGTSDDILSCWKTGPKFSFDGCDLRAVQPTHCEGGSSRIPDREHDPIVAARAPQRHAEWLIDNETVKILAPTPECSFKVKLREVRELEKIAERLV